MPGIGIITNPHSRRNRRFPERMRRLGYVLGEDDVCELTNQLEDVAQVAERFREREIDILALNGGDGTNHGTLTSFIEVYGDTPLPMIAFLRGGTMNTISNSIGIRGEPGGILLNLVEKYYTKQPFDLVERDMLKISDENGTNYGFIFGNGMISAFLDMYYGTGKPTPTMAARILVRAAVSALVGGATSRRLFEGFEAEIELDGALWPTERYSAVLIGSIEQIGLGWRPFTRCEEREGGFHVAAVRGTMKDVAMSLPTLRMGRRVSDHIIRDAVASAARFRSNQPIVYTIDGDMHRAEEEVLVEAGPRVKIIHG